MKLHTLFIIILFYLNTAVCGSEASDSVIKSFKKAGATIIKNVDDIKNYTHLENATYQSLSNIMDSISCFVLLHATLIYVKHDGSFFSLSNMTSLKPTPLDCIAIGFFCLGLSRLRDESNQYRHIYAQYFDKMLVGLGCAWLVGRTAYLIYNFYKKTKLPLEKKLLKR